MSAKPPPAPVFLILALAILIANPCLADTIRIAVAANFKPTLEALLVDFEARHHHRATISSASSGVLYNQITHGAPFHIFLSADAERPRLLEATGTGIAGSRFTYATGQLVLLYREDAARPEGDDPASLLMQPGLSLVMANPVSAPYGKAAQQVLASAGANTRSMRLLQASSVLQAYQMWYSGGADAALVSRSVAHPPFLNLPEDWYSPIEQQAILLQAGASLEGARTFLGYLSSEAARALIASHGYGVPPG